MSPDIPQYEKPDPVQRSIAKPDACAKPCSFTKSTKGVRIRPMLDKLKKRRKRDPRDVTFY